MDTENKKHLENLTEIRSIMERSSSFLSLSGLSGVFAGIFALIGAGFAYWYLYIYIPELSDEGQRLTKNFVSEIRIIIIADAIIILGAALITGFIFTYRNTKRKGLSLWNSTAKRLLINLLIPLFAGGIFSGILIFQNITYLIPSVTLMFYGLALVNASKYTLRDIRYLGIMEIILGLLAAVDYELFIWALGFGVLHIIYGTLMYYKYERNDKIAK